MAATKSYNEQQPDVLGVVGANIRPVRGQYNTARIRCLHFTGPPVPITARMHSTPQNNTTRMILLRFTGPAVPITARVHSTSQNNTARIIRYVTLLRFTAPPVPITARAISPPQSYE
eukprot:5707529-Pyramimonas_sp.AAC.2